MATPETTLTFWPWLILVVLYGACVGSFLNVAIYRMPAGESLVRPGSHCPHCRRPLAWFENVPLLSWVALRARCRTCGIAISGQYPLVEAFCAVLYGVTFWIYYATPLRPEFASAGLSGTWPVLLVHLVLLAALLAASVVDLKLFIIPLDIPNFVTLMAVLILPVAAIWIESTTVVAPTTGPALTAAAVGGLFGLAVAYTLLRAGRLPQSFADEAATEPGEAEHALGTPDDWLAYPHPRREVLKELLYLSWPVAGAVAGVVVQRRWLGGGDAVQWTAFSVLGGVVAGYLVGGGLIWGIRILGTLVFGKEAMGLGDVHVLAAIGAVLGGGDALIVFFIAPFAGLLGSAIVAGVGTLVKGKVKAIPYGPYLAVAAVIWVWFQMPLREVYATLFFPIP